MSPPITRPDRSSNTGSWNTESDRSGVPQTVAATFEPVKKLVDRIPQRLRNRYGLAVLVLVGWIAIFDRNDIWTTWKNHRELGKMEEQQEWYTAEITRTKGQLAEIHNDKDLLEKFARERYLMKRDNEDIFVLVPEK